VIMRVSLLQITDSMFPVGALSQSFGLEMLVSSGEVTKDNLCDYMRSMLMNQVGPCDMVFMLAAHKNIERAEQLSTRYGCRKLVPEFHMASLKMGKRMILLGARLTGDETIKKLEGKPVHHAVAFGTVASAMGASDEDAAHAFLYNWSAGVVSAAIRLMPLGHDAAQEILYDMGETIEMTYQRYHDLSVEDAWQFTPRVEIAGLEHGKLYTKLFLS
jgi:urease accessory protein